MKRRRPIRWYWLAWFWRWHCWAYLATWIPAQRALSIQPSMLMRDE
jgi:ABC-type lipoprotein release transport system permease subunit